MSVNKVILIGNLGGDPEVRTMQNGDKCANFTLATSERWKDRQTSEKKERTEWHRVVVWGPLAEIAERYARKGSKVYIQGALQTRKWTDQGGQERYTTEVVVKGFKAELQLLDKSAGEGQRAGNGADARGQDWQAPNYGGNLDDEIPFD